jgi:hypothetical protein
MVKRIMVLVFLLNSIVFAVGQENLLLNGELTGGGKKDYFKHWSIYSGTPDIYKNTFSLFMSCGFFSEAMQGRLIQPLDSRKYYKVVASVKADSRWCENFIPEISIGFSRDSIARSKKIGAIRLKKFPYVSLYSRDSSLIGKSEFVHVEGIYVAHGGEKFVIVGNIYPANMEIFKRETRKHSMYFYKNISVSEIVVNLYRCFGFDSLS